MTEGKFSLPTHCEQDGTYSHVSKNVALVLMVLPLLSLGVKSSPGYKCETRSLAQCASEHLILSSEFSGSWLVLNTHICIPFLFFKLHSINFGEQSWNKISGSICQSIKHKFLYFRNYWTFFLLAMPHSFWDLSFLTRDWTHALGSETWSPDHCTLREFPEIAGLILKSIISTSQKPPLAPWT